MLVHEGLELTATGALRRMASALGLPADDATTRAELVDRLTERLSDPTYLDGQIGSLSEDELAILIEARRSGGELRGLLLERDHPAEADALVDRGLLFRVFTTSGPRRGEVFAIADELLALLPEPAPAAALPAAEPAPADRRATDPAFSMFCLASAMSRAGGDLQQDVAAWSVEPGGFAWDARWAFLRHLAPSAGLLVRQADGALVPGPTLSRILDDPPVAADRLWRAYLRDRAWSDLAHALDLDPELADTLAVREALVNALEDVPEGEWRRIDDVSDWLAERNPTLLREQLSPRGLLELEARAWHDLELPLLRYLLFGPLYWLGRVSVNAEGSLVMRRPTPIRSAPEACTWDATHLVAPARAELGVLLQCERYLVLRERGRVSRYELLQAHVSATLASGGSIVECRQLLERLTGAALPPTIDERLRAWQQRFGALNVRPAVLVEARAAEDLDAALADDAVRRLLRARLSSTVAEVPAADALELAALLRQTGHLPRVDAALRLSADPRRAYASLVDQHVLEWLYVCLLAFEAARPEQLAELEGASTLLERLAHQFPPERLRELRATAARLAGELHARPQKPRRRAGRRRTR